MLRARTHCCASGAFCFVHLVRIMFLLPRSPPYHALPTEQARERLRHATAVCAEADTGYWAPHPNGEVRICHTNRAVGICAKYFLIQGRRGAARPIAVRPVGAGRPVWHPKGQREISAAAKNKKMRGNSQAPFFSSRFLGYFARTFRPTLGRGRGGQPPGHVVSFTLAAFV